MNREEIYREKAQKFTAERKVAQAKASRIGWSRLLVFLLAGTGVYFLYDTQAGLATGIGLAGIAGFLFLVKVHLGLQRQISRLRALERINNEEIQALKGDISAFPEGGNFHEPDHAFAHDLDIFGPTSIFQFLSRSATLIGQKKLAEGLKNPLLDKGLIKARQEAVKELAERLEQRQEFLAIGYQSQEKPHDPEQLRRWVDQPGNIAEASFYRWLLPTLSVVSLVFIALMIFGPLSFVHFLIYLAIPFFFVGREVKVISAQQEEVGKMFEMLRSYANLMEIIESEPCKSAHLKSIQQQLKHGEETGSAGIRKLARIIRVLEYRNNVIVALVLNALFLWDLWAIRRLQNWQRQYREDLHNWLDGVASWDALCSLANLAYNHSEYTFPEFSDKDDHLTAKGAGHPLLFIEGRVDNDFDLGNGVNFTILTGANMAGKSTFLRTIGVNLVLAMQGAPVCASSFSFQPRTLFTSMRTTDSLQHHESYFYTELKRLKAIVDKLQAGEQLFIILDEILKGTNSRDKESGSKAFVRKLVGLGAVGIIATHDLALCTIEQEMDGSIRNQCFEVEINGSGLHFDYLIKSGVCQNMNATYLMKEMGITG